MLLLAVGTAATSAAAGQQAERIVSLAPHITELLFAAGAGSHVVGVSAYSDYPAAARDLPTVGDAFRFDYETIIALRPDLAVAWQSGTPPQAVKHLEELGVPVTMLRVARLADIAPAVVELGRLAGTEDQARKTARLFREQLDALREAHAAEPKVSVFVELDERPLFTVTGAHPISELVSLCGGRNVFARLPGLAPPVDLEAVVAADPEVILYTGPGSDPAGYWQGRSEIRAVRDGNILRVSPDLVSRATPRVIEGAREVCRLLDDVRRRLGGAVNPSAARAATGLPAPVHGAPARVP